MRRPVLAFSIVTAGLAIPLIASAGWPLGSRIDGSALVDVTPDGFALLPALASSFIPSAIPVPTTELADEGGCVPFIGCSYSYDIVVNDLNVGVGINAFDLVPGSSVLDLDGDLTVQAGTAAAPGIVSFDASLLGIPINDTCDLYTDPIDVTIGGTVGLALIPDPAGIDVDGDGIPDTKKLDASIPPLGWSWDANADKIHFTNCGTADVINTINDVLDFFGFNIYDVILDQVTPQIDSLVNSLPATLEPLLEDNFGFLTISQSLDLLDVPLSFTVWPQTLQIQPEGLRVGMSSVIDVPPSPCVAEWDPGESVATPSTPPSIAETAASVPFGPHVAAFIDDDFVNHFLYSAWAGGLLCYDLAPGSDLIPLPLDTSLLNLLSQNAFEPLFPTAEPIEIRTQPRQSPVLVPGPHAANVEVDQLGLGFITTLDGRKTRLLGVDLKVDAGADVTFDNTTGALAIQVDAGEGAFTPSVAYDEFFPDTADAIGASFGSLIDTAVGPLISSLLGNLSFKIPGFEGIGLTEIATGVGGSSQDYVAAWGEAGTVSYASAGCNGSSSSGCNCSSSGCDSSGCSSGCNSGGPVAMITFPIVVALLRRRRR